MKYQSITVYYVRIGDEVPVEPSAGFYWYDESVEDDHPHGPYATHSEAATAAGVFLDEHDAALNASKEHP
jgi:TPR repeat protein